MPNDERLPYIRFYVIEFFGDHRVRRMTSEQRAFYLLLLMEAWIQDPPCTIPADTEEIADLLGIDANRWHNELADRILPCWQPTDNGRLTQARLLQEYERADAKRQAQSRGGRKGAEARKGNGNGSTPQVTCKSPASKSRRPRFTPEQVEEIRQAYPKMKKKAAAEKAIQGAAGKVGFEELLAKVKQYAEARTLPNGRLAPYTPDPPPWFNQECWTDDPTTWIPDNGEAPKVDQATLESRARQQRYEQEQRARAEEAKRRRPSAPPAKFSDLVKQKRCEAGGET